MEKNEFHLPHFFFLNAINSSLLKTDGFICTGDNAFAESEISRISINRQNEERHLEVQLKDGSVHYESKEGYKRLLGYYQEHFDAQEAKKK